VQSHTAITIDVERDHASRPDHPIEIDINHEGPWSKTAEDVATRHERERDERARKERARFDLD